MSKDLNAPVSLWRSGVLGHCPRCGKTSMFKGWLSLYEHCPQCNLPLGEYEKGDGPAFFAITIIGALACLFAAIVELRYQPPYWIHAVLWLPFIVIGSLIILRLAKAIIVALHYEHLSKER
ncbi:MAG: DUF983 domain-containing protein [Rickettsiales bacterium]